MLYAPAVCENCAAVFHSGQLIAENDGEFASYRRSAGPCPRCGGRGIIPEWVFRFHASASAAADRATPEQLGSLIQVLRERMNPAQPALPGTADDDLGDDLGGELAAGPWAGVAVEIRRTPADQWAAKLTFLWWIVERSDRRHGIRGNGAIELPPDSGPADTFDEATDLGSLSCSPFTVIDPPGPGYPGIAVTVSRTRRAS